MSGDVRVIAPSVVDWTLSICRRSRAETPSQLMIFLLAANLGGAALGMAGLGMFLAGLLVMNALMTASAAGVFGVSRNHP